MTTRPDSEVWIADFKADGLWTFAYRGKAEIQHSGLFTERTAGKYSASDDTLTIEADYHCAAFEHTQRSRYSWMLRNRRLVLRVQHDPCRERRKCLDGVVYRSRHAHST